MVQLSKILHSRDNWKRTTIGCRYEIREFKKTKQRHLKKIAELKQENRELKHQALEVKKHLCNVNRGVEPVRPFAPAEVGKGSQLIDIKDTDQTRMLYVLLTLNAVVSYRSVPRILELFKSKTNYAVGWVPHFTSMINSRVESAITDQSPYRSVREQFTHTVLR